MKGYSRKQFIVFAAVNTIMTLLIIALFFMSLGLAGAFTAKDEIYETMTNVFIIFAIVFLVDGMKWLAFYFIMKKGYKKWYIFYIIYLLIFVYFAFYTLVALIVPLIYLITFIYVDKDLLFKYQ